MKRITLVAVGAAVLVVSTTALAQPNTSSRNGTMVRALEVNARNQAKNPQSQGLPNARQQLLENAEKHAAHRADRENRLDGVERVERPERPQVALSPSIAERPLPPGQVDRPLPPGQVDRPLPPGLADRPLPPGHARRR
jgi:hypothetical protein